MFSYLLLSVACVNCLFIPLAYCFTELFVFSVTSFPMMITVILILKDVWPTAGRKQTFVKSVSVAMLRGCLLPAIIVNLCDKNRLPLC